MTKRIIQQFIPYSLGVKLRGAWQKILGFYYSGDSYYCPLCRFSFRKMLPAGIKNPVFRNYRIIGGGYRRNALCPRCYSTDRDRLVFSYIQNIANLFHPAFSVLHIAPEGALRAFFMNQTNVGYRTGFKDADAYKGYYYQQNLQAIDITDIPFASDSFDLIICNHVLEHVPEDIKAMKELCRVMKPGGHGIMQVPIAADLPKTYENPMIQTDKGRLKEYGQHDHVRIYGNDYADKLRNAGFEVEVVDLYITDPEWFKKLAVNPAEKLFIARKQL